MPIGVFTVPAASQPPPFGNAPAGEYLGQRLVPLSPTAATTRRLTAQDSGTTYLNLTTKVMTYLLPAPIAGAEFTFGTVQNPADVVTAPSAIFYGKSDASANTTMTFTGAANNNIVVRSDGNFWFTVSASASNVLNWT